MLKDTTYDVKKERSKLDILESMLLNCDVMYTLWMLTLVLCLAGDTLSENIALKRPAYAHDAWNETSRVGAMEPVDGDRSVCARLNTTGTTASRGTGRRRGARWWVDLGHTYAVSNVTVWGATDVNMITPYVVGVQASDDIEDDVICGISEGDSITFPCPTAAMGRHVYVRELWELEEPGQLVICEVEVTGLIVMETGPTTDLTGQTTLSDSGGREKSLNVAWIILGVVAAGLIISISINVWLGCKMTHQRHNETKTSDPETKGTTDDVPSLVASILPEPTQTNPKPCKYRNEKPKNWLKNETEDRTKIPQEAGSDKNEQNLATALPKAGHIVEKRKTQHLEPRRDPFYNNLPPRRVKTAPAIKPKSARPAVQQTPPPPPPPQKPGDTGPPDPSESEKSEYGNLMAYKLNRLVSLSGGAPLLRSRSDLHRSKQAFAAAEDGHESSSEDGEPVETAGTDYENVQEVLDGAGVGGKPGASAGHVGGMYVNASAARDVINAATSQSHEDGKRQQLMAHTNESANA